MNIFENNFITQFPKTTIKFLNEFLSKNEAKSLQYNWKEIFYKNPIFFEEIAKVFIKHHQIDFLENELNFNYYNQFLFQYKISTVNTILIEDSTEHFKKNFPNYLEPMKNLYLNMQNKNHIYDTTPLMSLIHYKVSDNKDEIADKLEKAKFILDNNLFFEDDYQVFFDYIFLKEEHGAELTQKIINNKELIKHLLSYFQKQENLESYINDYLKLLSHSKKELATSMINLLIDNNLISLGNLKNDFFPPMSAIYFCEKNNTQIPIKNDLNSGFIIPHFKLITRSQILKILFEGQLQTMENSLENAINRFKIKEKKYEILNSITYNKLFKYEENIGTIIISNEDKKIKTNTLVGLSMLDIEIAEHYLAQINNKKDILRDSQHLLNRIGKVVNHEISEKLNDLQALINKNVLEEQQPISQKNTKLKL